MWVRRGVLHGGPAQSGESPPISVAPDDSADSPVSSSGSRLSATRSTEAISYSRLGSEAAPDWVMKHPPESPPNCNRHVTEKLGQRNANAPASQ